MSFTPLPDPLPADPLALLDAWLRDAVEALGPEHRNPTAMTLATCGRDLRPDARVVLCRGFDAARGVLTFYTDRSSPKGQQLAENPRATAVFYWEALYRQVRVSGPVRETSDDASDAYFESRPRGGRISASVSHQSRPLGSRAELEARYAEQEGRLEREGAPTLKRPDRWGGYEVWIEHVEFWVGRLDRLHDRARYERVLRPDGDGFAGSGWQAVRLEP